MLAGNPPTFAHPCVGCHSLALGGESRPQARSDRCSLPLPPGLPHGDSRFGDGDQRLPVSHWSDGGTVYIPGTPRGLCREGRSEGGGERGPGALPVKGVTQDFCSLSGFSRRAVFPCLVNLVRERS